MDSSFLQYFSSSLKPIVRNLGDNVTEIRLRKNAPLVVMIGNKRFFASTGGCLTSVCGSGCFIVDGENLQRTFEAVCRYSVHSFHENICEGFITLDGGHRVGICGTAVMNGRELVNIKDISSLNFRIAHSVKGCAEGIFGKYSGEKPCSILIAGPPASGKTTLLRDLCRCMGDRYKTSVIDSRGELAAVYGGVPQNDVGVNTDVLNGYPKSRGIETAVRVMSPQVIVCDEIGSNDSAAVEYASLCGVNICTTVHGSCMEDVERKLPFWDKFDVTVFLSSCGRAGEISEIREMRSLNENDTFRNTYNADVNDGGLRFVGTEKAV